MICPHCNQNLPEGLIVCFYCGYHVGTQAVAQPFQTDMQAQSEQAPVEQTYAEQTYAEQAYVSQEQAKGKKNNLTIMIAVAAVVLLIGGTIGGHFLGFYDLPFLPSKAEAEDENPPAIETPETPDMSIQETPFIDVQETPNVDSQDAFDVDVQETPPPDSNDEQSPRPDRRPEAHQSPVFTRALASATLQPSSTGTRYDPELVLDGRTDTAWAYTGRGGHWIELFAGSDQHVSGIRILNGYTKFNENMNLWLYHANNRPKDIRIVLSDGTSISVTLNDDFDRDNPIFQEIWFDSVKLTNSIRIYIDSIYLGDRWDDTCITLVEVH